MGVAAGQEDNLQVLLVAFLGHPREALDVMVVYLDLDHTGIQVIY